MSKYFSGIVISFLGIFVVNIIWIIMISVILATRGIYYLIQDYGIIGSIAIGPILKWILLIDIVWIVAFLIYVYKRKKFKVDSKKYYLQYDPIIKPKVCVVIPAFNEELSIKQVVNSYIKQESVIEVLVIDNHSEDKTVEIARAEGARVITKDKNYGYEHSWTMGLIEAAKTEANLIVISEADSTLSGEDLEKMLPYVQHCDVIYGSRQVQLLTEDMNLRQNLMHVWGNYILSKILQLKYLNLVYLGIVNINDINTGHRMFRKNVITKLQSQFMYPNSELPISGKSFPIYLLMKILENDFRVIEIPVTYKKRIGQSKVGSTNFFKNVKAGFTNMWIILRY